MKGVLFNANAYSIPSVNSAMGSDMPKMPLGLPIVSFDTPKVKSFRVIFSKETTSVP